MKEEITATIKSALEKMGCTDVIIKQEKSFFVAKFNCVELTSFVTKIPGWEYSGTRLDPKKERQYQIEFKQSL